MYLINTTSLKLEYFPDERGLEYAILSHCWGPDEVLFKDMIDDSRRQAIEKLAGYDKIVQCCRLARRFNLAYAWVDTCCIDKSSSAELQEAINSMFRWYQSAVVCFAFLADVPSVFDYTQFRDSRWFRRGWTLQELLAPDKVIFFTGSWSEFSTRNELASSISEITGIETAILQKRYDPDNQPIAAEIMSWACGRETTRVEDRAYSLLGLFDINMPMLYGEGDKAFKRLQEEMMRNKFDSSIFLWTGLKPGHKGLLAPSPDHFTIKFSPSQYSSIGLSKRKRQQNVMSNKDGTSFDVDLVAWRPFVYVGVMCRYYRRQSDSTILGIFLKAVDDEDCYIRVKHEGKDWVEIEEEEIFDTTGKHHSNVLANRPIHVMYRLDIWQGVVAKMPMVPFACKILLTGSCTRRSECAVDLHCGATWSNDREMVNLRNGTSGTFCTIKVPSAGYSIGSKQIHKTGHFEMELGLDNRFLPYCILLWNAKMSEREEWRQNPFQAADGLVWHKTPGDISQSLVAVKNLNASTSEYVFLWDRSDSLLVRTQSSMYTMRNLMGGGISLLSFGVQLDTGDQLLYCEVTTSMSKYFGWECRIDFSGMR